jgi:hypothetical protein
VTELIVWLPEVDLEPDQAWVALQLVALLEDQVSWVEPPEATGFGAALRETVGAGADPGGGVLPPPLLVTPTLPPHAARPSVHASASDVL